VLEPSARAVLNRLPGLVQTADAAIVAWEHKDSLVGVLYLDSVCEELSLLLSRCCQSWEDTLAAEIPGAVLVMGVAGRSESLTGVKTAYEQAKQAAWVCKALDGFAKPCHFRDLGIFQLLTPIWDSNLEGFSRQMLGPLLAMKEPKRQEYFETLEALLGTDTQKAAAEKMFVHEKTIQFRKQRIESVLGCSLDNAAQRMALSMAMRCWKNKNTDSFYRAR
jgi:DNA-binding PucR family transcriptional regulator